MTYPSLCLDSSMHPLPPPLATNAFTPVLQQKKTVSVCVCLCVWGGLYRGNRTVQPDGVNSVSFAMKIAETGETGSVPP
jgi:hypothetical protein